MTSSPCPDISDLQAVLEENGGTEREADDLYHHLDSCVVCQQVIEGLAADPAVWDETARGLKERSGQEPALTRVVEQLKNEDPLPIDDTDLSFLRPTDRPGLLGLLGQYEVQEEIGRGGMGVVLKAFDPQLNRVVAIKVLAPRLSTSAVARRRFIREGRAAAAVTHDHIVTIHGVSEADGLPYIVMRHICESLQDRIDRAGPLEMAEIVRIGQETASGLAAAHAQGLIHRDIKPANLLLENGFGRVQITDFGLAHMADDAQLTHNGVVTGTPEYMAPEQARGERVDHRADLFSLGSVLYAMCTGVSPFHGMSAVAVLRQVSDEAPFPIRSLNPKVPVWLETLIGRLMAKDPAERFESAAEVAALLDGYRTHLGQPGRVPAPELSAVPFAEEIRKKLRPSLFIVSFIATAVGLGVASWFTGFGGEPDVKQEASKDGLTQEYYLSFKGAPKNMERLELIGPDADECVKFEPSGLRITLPTGYPEKRVATGLAANFGIQGDFEITIGFEMLKEPEPTHTGQGTGVFVGVDLNTEEYNRATLTRGMGEGGQFTTWFQLTSAGSDNPREEELKSFPTAATTGRLRIVRTDAILSYQVAEGFKNEFTLLDKHPFSKEDLKQVRIGGQTGGSEASLDARVIDLRIRAASLANVPGQDGASKGETSRQPGDKDWLAAALIVGLVTTLTLVLGLWFFFRQRRGADEGPAKAPDKYEQDKPAAVARPIFFRCSGCMKKLKAKAALAGKKVMCPKCYKAVRVPAPEVVESNVSDTGP
jgi:serine/threonine protein kinase